MKEIFGLLPAAGQGLRMRPFQYPKELLPVHFYLTDQDNFIKPKLLIEYSLDAFALATVTNTIIIIPDWKPEIMRYLEDGKQFGQYISYVYNNRLQGLADALLSGYSWLHNKLTCFAMPDTLFKPATAFQDLIEIFLKKDADLVLGVFPTKEAQHFGVVEFNDDNKVLAVWEKPVVPKYDNAWGIAVWSTKFWDFFKTSSTNYNNGLSVTDVFGDAVKAGLNVYCKYFADGWYKDIGRIESISIIK